MAAYVTYVDVRKYLNISGSDDDALLIELIAGAQAAIDRYTKRTFSSTANATRRFTVGRDTDGRKLYLDGDLASINAVVTDADSTAPTTVTTSEYFTHPRNVAPYHALELRSNADVSWTYTSEPEMGITVSGKWAFSTAPPEDIQRATVRLAAYYYRQRGAQVFDVTASPTTGQITIPQGMPKDVEKLLKPFIRPVLVYAY